MLIPMNMKWNNRKATNPFLAFERSNWLSSWQMIQGFGSVGTFYLRISFRKELANPIFNVWTMIWNEFHKTSINPILKITKILIIINKTSGKHVICGWLPRGTILLWGSILLCVVSHWTITMSMFFRVESMYPLKNL